MEKQLLKALLNYEFYEANKHKLRASLFVDEARDLFEIVSESHNKYGHDLTPNELNLLWQNANPVATNAEKELFHEIINQISDAPDLSPDLAKDLIDGLWKRHAGRKIANFGIQIAEGQEEAYKRLETFLEGLKNGFAPDDLPDPVDMDLDHLITSDLSGEGYRLNLIQLQRHIPVVAKQDFVIVFATPEAGKTAFCVSLVAGPDGFCEQGAKVLYLGNEERIQKTVLRAVYANTGMPKEEVLDDPDRAKTRFAKIKDNLIFQDATGWSIDQVDAYIDKINPDVVVLDQADKITIDNGGDLPKHERLRDLYTQLRILGHKKDILLIAVSQASNDAAGKTRLSAHDMEGSKIGKFAEADLIFGIGKQESIDDDDPVRFITVSKNKLSGWHDTVICNLRYGISRYVD